MASQPLKLISFGAYRLAVFEQDPGWLVAVYGPGIQGEARDIGQFYTHREAGLGALLQHAKTRIVAQSLQG